MPTYIVGAKLTEAGARVLLKEPQKVVELVKELENYGVKYQAAYVTLGEFDMVCIVEAPDLETLLKSLLDLNSRGLMHTTTLPALKVI